MWLVAADNFSSLWRGGLEIVMNFGLVTIEAIVYEYVCFYIPANICYYQPLVMPGSILNYGPICHFDC